MRLILLLIIGVLGATASAADRRVQEELNSPTSIPALAGAIGEEELANVLATGKYSYVGNTKCRLCHRDFFVGRKMDAHDHALTNIATLPEASNPRCLVCHSTGFGLPGGFVSMEETPRLANVQCEGCHGPGSEHVARRDKGGFLAGTDHLPYLKKMCTGCHTARWNRSFSNLDTAFAKYKHARPE